MNSENAFAAAVVGALAYLVLQLIAPLGVGLGRLGVSFWLLPLVAVHLWPRGASVTWSVVLLLGLGLTADFYGGLRLGTSPMLALAMFALIRPESRPLEVGEWRMWVVFAGTLAIIVLVLALVTGEWRRPAPLLVDMAIPILLFPLVFRLMRLSRGRGGDSREAFP